MKLKLFATALALSAGLAGGASAATSVFAVNSGTTDLGAFAAGTYHITASGIVDLVGSPGSGFDIDPNGRPTTPITAPGYGYFNPDGSTSADGNFGPGGSTIKIGALMGSLIPVAPLGDFAGPQSNYFFLGESSDVTLASAGHIYAQVNDTFYSNDGGSFQVSVSAAPEPGVWALMFGGIGLAGLALRRRKEQAGATFAA